MMGFLSKRMVQTWSNLLHRGMFVLEVDGK